MAEQKKTLLMTFDTEGQKKASLTLANIKDGLTGAMAKEAMQAMVDSGIFTTPSGAYTAPYRAEIVERTATTLFGGE